jgi:hypothetical protein
MVEQKPVAFPSSCPCSAIPKSAIGCRSGAVGTESMENIPIIDRFNPHIWWLYGLNTPYIRHINYGQLKNETYKEEVAGSSPVPPTKKPLYMGVFAFYTPYMVVGVWANLFWVQIGCSWVQLGNFYRRD